MPCEEEASTVPTTRPVPASTRSTGRPPVLRRSARSVGRARSVQNQPAGRRRSSPAAVSAATPSAADGPNSGRSSSRSGSSAAAAAQVRTEDVGVARVEDGGLHGSTDQRLGVGDEVGVQRVVAGHQHREGVGAPPAGAADLLPHRGPGAGEPGHEHRVESRDVDAELEGVRRGHPAQLARRGARPRGPGGPRAGSRPGRPRPRGTARARPRRAAAAAVSATVSAPRRERTNASVRTPSATRSASRSATSAVAARRTGAPFSPAYDVNGGSHSPSETWPRAEVSSVTASTSRPVSRPAETAGSATVAEARTKVGRGAVVRGEPTQPAQHQGDVGPEDAAVVVALVDDDVAAAGRGSATTARGRAAGSGGACRGS